MLLLYLINTLFESIDKDLVRNGVVFSDLYVQFHAMPVKLVANVNIIIDSKLVAANESFRGALYDLNQFYFQFRGKMHVLLSKAASNFFLIEDNLIISI
jgi:hypothetical protein